MRVGKFVINNTISGREWIDLRPHAAKAFWQEVPRRLRISTPWGTFMMAYTPDSRWAKNYDPVTNTWDLAWIEWEPAKSDAE